MSQKVKATIRLKGGKGSGFTSEAGHKGIPGHQGGSQSSDFQAVVVGKNKYNKRTRSAFVDYYGYPMIESRRAIMEPIWEDMNKTEREQKAKLFGVTFDEDGYPNYPKDSPSVHNPMLAYNSQERELSYAKDPTGGFPIDNVLADPANRVSIVNEAASALSYSNMVGYGGALKAAAAGDTEDELYQMFSKKLPADVTLEDVLKAMYVESQGLIANSGLTGKSIILYHGTGTDVGSKREYSLFDVGKNYKGMSSWSLYEHVAAGFGGKTIKSSVPLNRIISVPGLMPPTIGNMGGLAFLFGGTRNEDEFIVLSDDAIERLK
jgi:hypothetical protein